MTDATTTTSTAPKLTVGYNRKVSVRPYESAEASIFVQADIQGTYNEDGLFVPDDNAVNEAAKLAFFEAKVAVLNQLCLPYDVVENVVVEQIDKVLGPVDVIKQETPSQKASAARNPAPAAASGGKTEDTAAAWDDLLNDTSGWFDNRTDKISAKSPDFKAKKTNKNIAANKGLWLDSKTTPQAALDAFGN